MIFKASSPPSPFSLPCSHVFSLERGYILAGYRHEAVVVLILSSQTYNLTTSLANDVTLPCIETTFLYCNTFSVKGVMVTVLKRLNLIH